MFNQMPIAALGGASSIARGIGPNGEVVGWAETSSGRKHAFFFDANGSRDLGVLQLPIPPAFAGFVSEESFGEAVMQSALGGYLVVGRGRASTISSPPNPIPGNMLIVERAAIFTIDVDGAISSRDLGTLVNGPFPGVYLGSSEARAVNSHGQIVGVSDTTATGGPKQAFLFDARLPVPMINIGTLDKDPATGAFRGASEALAINDSGEVVGISDTGQLDANNQPIRHAFLYDSSTMAMKDLGTLMSGIAAGPADAMSEARSINNSGRIVGTSTTLDAHGTRVQRAFFYDRSIVGGQFISDLGTFDSINQVGRFRDRGNSAANCLNNLDHVVGFAETNVVGAGGIRERHAFRTRTTFGNPLIDLDQEMLINPGGIAEEATGVNDLGQICVNVTAGGVTSAFLLTPGP